MTRDQILAVVTKHLVDAVEDGLRLLRSGVDARPASAASLAWRLISRGRTGIDPDSIRAMAMACGSPGASGGDEIARAGLSYEAEWKAA